MQRCPCPCSQARSGAFLLVPQSPGLGHRDSGVTKSTAAVESSSHSSRVPPKTHRPLPSLRLLTRLCPAAPAHHLRALRQHEEASQHQPAHDQAPSPQVPLEEAQHLLIHSGGKLGTVQQLK